MRWTRLSFLYLITYLAMGGADLIAAPGLATQLLGAEMAYPPALLWLAGALLCGLAVLVFEIRRHQVEVLYPTTLVARVLIVTVTIAS